VTPYTNVRSFLKILAIGLLGGCSASPPAEQTIRDHYFYGGLAAFHSDMHADAARQWQRAAELGDGEAARNLGHLYRQGLGVDQDVAAAVKWYQIASAVGVPSAEYNLGMVYLNGGPNFATDRTKALYWLTKSADAGVIPARKELDRLAAEPSIPAASPSASPAAPAQASPPPPPAPARVQIGSYQTRKAAEGDLARITRRSDLRLEIVNGRAKDGKPWYRLMAQGTAEQLDAYCRDAAAHRIGCWPRRAE
jgi:TPR repeat protein